ncbi:MAG: TfoX/Sxy family protein [Alphaproteobacteria bacterium]
MARRSEYADYVVERLAPLGAVTARPMFGGHGIFMDGVMFALIASETLYLKVDEGNRAAYEARGAAPFRPFANRPSAMAYYEAPAEIFEEQEDLVDWAREAFAAALRARKAKKPKRPSRRSTPGD